jgi:hypothetical protein
LLRCGEHKDSAAITPHIQMRSIWMCAEIKPRTLNYACRRKAAGVEVSCVL